MDERRKKDGQRDMKHLTAKVPELPHAQRQAIMLQLAAIEGQVASLGRQAACSNPRICSKWLSPSESVMTYRELIQNKPQNVGTLWLTACRIIRVLAGKHGLGMEEVVWF